MANEAVRGIISGALAEARLNLLEPEAKQICLAYDIPTPAFQVAASPEEARTHAEKLGYPVVLKIISPDILHKTDVRGVVVGLSSADEVQSAYSCIMEAVRTTRPDARLYGVLVQKMAPEATEVIVGSINDPQFGPTVLFGLGGIFTEILKDVVFRVAPLEELDAREMISEIRGYPVITGHRGFPAADQDAIVNVILKTSRLVIENPRIAEVDLNPVMAYPRGALVADARMVLSS